MAKKLPPGKSSRERQAESLPDWLVVASGKVSHAV
jgi:hypothetical protein